MMTPRSTGKLQIVRSLARLRCTKCGAEADASCNCGEPYLPAAIRVKEYDKANPGKSTRAAAADLGISKSEVGRARLSVVLDGTPETVTGLDGKTYKAKGKARAPKKEEPIAAAPPKAIVEPAAVDTEPGDEQPAEFDFENFKKHAAALALHAERFTPAQAREIESLVRQAFDKICEIVEADDDRKRRIKEVKNPQRFLDDSRKLEQRYEMEDDRNEAKREARENGESWSDVKDEWEAEWFADHWDDKREQEFLDAFKAEWKRNHGREFPDSDFAQHRAAMGGGES
jgi:hypothetical protein